MSELHSPDHPTSQSQEYAPLLKMRHAVFPRFVKDQAIAAERIFDQIEPLIQSNTISTIVDVGCGTGEILTLLAAKIWKEHRHKRMHYFGFDCCVAEIAKAKRSDKTCLFEVRKAQDLAQWWQTVHNNELNDGISGSTTLFLCVGHTLPHFLELDGFLTVLSEVIRPAFLIVDFYHLWDEAVRELEGAPTKERREPKALSKKLETYVLASKVLDSANLLMSRGIKKVALKNKRMQILDTSFATTQLMHPKSYFLRKLEDKCRYTLSAELDYHGGYGPMNAYLLTHRSRRSSALNEEYFNVLQEFLIRHTGPNGPLDAILKKAPFDNAALAAILPFDKHHTFARYIRLSNIPAPTEEMLLTVPNRLQSSYPTAAGLFRTMLGQVSSSTVLPITELADGVRSETDVRFRRKEKKFFHDCSLDRSELEHKGRSKALGYFVVPVYYGRLPLFCLITSASDLDPSDTEQQQLYYMHLRDKERRISRYIDSVFEWEILRPFCDRAMDSLMAIPSLHDKSTVTRVGEITKGFRNSEQKPWKSWVIAVPTLPIKEIAEVDREQKKLEQQIGLALEAVAQDPYMRISKWLQSCRFFGDLDDQSARSRGLHEQWSPDHSALLKDSLRNIGIEPSTVHPFKETSYFGEAGSLLDWTQGKVEAILSGDAVRATPAFRDLKNVFCRNAVNTGRNFKFGLDRLRCLCEIATESKCTVRCLGRESVPPYVLESGEDQLQLLRDLISSLGMVDSITVACNEISLESATCEIRYTVTINLSETFRPPPSGGMDFASFESPFKKLSGLAEIPEFKTLTIEFDVQAQIGRGRDTRPRIEHAKWRVIDNHSIRVKPT